MIFDPKTLQQYRLAYLKLRAISGSARYMMLNIIQTNAGINVGQIVEKSKLEQPIVSQLLSVLRKADFVYAEANQKEKKYYINAEEIERMIAFASYISETNLPSKQGLANNYTILQTAYKTLKTLLNPSRMILVDILSKYGEKSVNEIAELTRQPQPVVSQNLSVLKTLLIVLAQPLGRKSIYRLNPDVLARYKTGLDRFFAIK